MTADEINALPKRVRDYIRDIETKCDPTGDVQTIWSQREQIAGLVARVRELETQFICVLFALALVVILFV